jgi:serine/threonine-protein kinase
VNYTEQVLGALSYAHRRNVIHRDIKPANMMLTPEGVVKLMDFGIARSSGDTGLTMAGTTIGSLYYMSPEQVKGETTDARSDLYSLGVSLYEMVTGQRPFRADSDYSLMAAHVQELPKPPVELRSDLPAALNEIILTAIAKEPGRRFQSADAFRNALGSLRGPLPAAFAVNQSLSPIAPSNPVAGATAILQNVAGPISGTEVSAAPFEPPAQSEAVPSVLQLSPGQKTHRGLYMSLGALVVLVVLVVAGLYIPRGATTKANDQAHGTQKSNDSSAAATSSSSVPDTDKTKAPDSQSVNKTEAQQSAEQSAHDAAQPSETKGDMIIPTTADSAGSKPGDQNQQVSTADAGKPKKKHALNVESKVAAAPGGGQQDKNVAPAAGGGQQDEHPGQGAGSARADAAKLEALEEQSDQLSSRVSSINDSLDNLRNQQSANGYGLRADIASAQDLMKTHLAKAQAALQNQDAAGAKKYLDLAEGDAARIDKFLGR